MPPVCLPSHFFLFPNSQLIPQCTKHCVFTGKCNLCASRPIFSYSLIRNLFRNAKNIVFSEVNAACVSRPIFSYSLIHNLFQHAQNIVMCMSLSSHFFLFPNSRLIRLMWPCQWIMSLIMLLLLFKRKIFPIFN